VEAASKALLSRGSPLLAEHSFWLLIGQGTSKCDTHPQNIVSLKSSTSPQSIPNHCEITSEGITFVGRQLSASTADNPEHLQTSHWTHHKCFGVSTCSQLGTSHPAVAVLAYFEVLLRRHLSEGRLLYHLRNFACITHRSDGKNRFVISALVTPADTREKVQCKYMHQILGGC